MSSGSLFEVQTRTDRSPSHARESLIDFLNRAAGPYWDRVREHLTVWVDQYPAQHRDDVRGRMCSRIDIDFHAAYWELFNFQVMSRAGFELTCHPEMPGTGRRPDFLVGGSGSRFYLEAKLLGDSHSPLPFRSLAQATTAWHREPGRRPRRHPRAGPCPTTRAVVELRASASKR